MTFVRQLLPPSTNTIAAVSQSRIIYMNKGGVTLTPGNNDARTNRSTLVSSTRAIPAWNPSATTWTGVMTCMKDMFSRWDVSVVDVDPGNVPHMEAIFTGSPSSIGMSSGVGGVSPFTQDCSVIENSIVFTFTNAFGNNAQTLCEVMAQEVAHSYGLDHQMLASDPMTYLSYSGKRTFKDQTVSCGEYQNRPCGIGGSVCRPNQNSVQLLNARLGIADAVAPMMTITSPADGATVEPGFNVEATASDNVAVTQATFFLDDVMITTTPGAGPYVFPTDALLAEGPHTISVEVTDGRNVQRQTHHITVAKPGGGGSGSGDGSGSDTDGDGDVDEDDMNGDDGLNGGCSSTRDVGFALGLFLLAHLMIRRRRYV
ncbi:MAG TPA: Ig-like domain-containing protein [Kofleriaceae bacterium]